MLNKWNKVIYDHYLKNHPLKNRLHPDNEEMVYNLIDTVYTGIPNDDEGLSKITNNEHFKLAAKPRRGRLDRTLNFVDKTLDMLESADTSDDNIGEVDQNQARIDNMLGGSGFAKTVSDLNDAEKAVESILGSGAGEGVGDSSEAAQAQSERVQMMRQYYCDERMRKIIDNFGTFYSHMTQVSRKRLFPDRTNIIDVTVGNDIEQLLSDELIKFAVPELETLAMAQYATESLLQFETGVEQSTGKGGVIVALDVSASMDIGGRLDLSIALIMALIKTMDKRKRRWKLSTFNVRTTRTWSSDTTNFSKLVHDLLRLQPSGGTKILKNISDMYEMVETDEDDILLVSDAEQSKSDCLDRLLKLKEEKGARLYSILLAPTIPDVIDKVVDGCIQGSSVEDLKEFSEFAIKN